MTTFDWFELCVVYGCGMMVGIGFSMVVVALFDGIGRTK